MNTLEKNQKSSFDIVINIPMSFMCLGVSHASCSALIILGI